MKLVEPNHFTDPDAAAHKLIEIANGVEAVQDGRIFIERVNGPFLFEVQGTPDQYLAGLNYAIERGWIVKHESGTFIRFTQLPKVEQKHEKWQTAIEVLIMAAEGRGPLMHARIGVLQA
jgi:hypothetical protein